MFVDLNDPNRETDAIEIMGVKYEFDLLLEAEAKQIQARIDAFEGKGKSQVKFWTMLAKEILQLWNDIEDDFMFGSEEEIVAFINLLHTKLKNAPHTHIEDL